MGVRAPTPVGWHIPDPGPSAPGSIGLSAALQQLDTPFAVVLSGDQPRVVQGGQTLLGTGSPPSHALPLLAYVPALLPDQLGDPSFRASYGTRVNYVGGAMANGISSVEMVVAMARGGMLGFFGAAGLSTERVTAAIDAISAQVGELPWGINLIHSPAEPWQEQQTVELLLARRVRIVSASAYLKLTPMLVQYRCSGLRQGPDGVIVPNHVLAKVSREEVAVHFLRPPPPAMVQALVQAGKLSPAEAALAGQITMADDLTAEADSGGHTDNQAAPVLLPLLQSLRHRVSAEHPAAKAVRIGAAGGLSTPAAVAAAFAIGADYVVTGTVNQACVEAGTSPMVKEMLAQAQTGDVGMAPASDMFEAGVTVQVLKRGTMFAVRGQRLYEIYRRYDSLNALPQAVRSELEAKILGRPLDDIWADCTQFFNQRDPAQLSRAADDPHHKMALIFRWYLGMASRWAIQGQASRRLDAQIWCGPAIGAFNAWTQGSLLASPEHRKVVVVGANLLAGAAAITRARWLLHQGVDAGPTALRWEPRPLAT